MASSQRLEDGSVEGEGWETSGYGNGQRETQRPVWEVGSRLQKNRAVELGRSRCCEQPAGPSKTSRRCDSSHVERPQAPVAQQRPL